MSAPGTLPDHDETTADMHETTPSVFLVARPSVDVDGMRAYLEDVGGASWLELRSARPKARANDGELLLEFAGRVCTAAGSRA